MLIVPVPAVELKLPPIYDVGAPVCDGNTALLPWNHVVEPTGALLFCANQPAPGTFAVTVSKPSVISVGVHVGFGLGVGDAGGGVGVGVGVGVEPPPDVPLILNGKS